MGIYLSKRFLAAQFKVIHCIKLPNKFPNGFRPVISLINSTDQSDNGKDWEYLLPFHTQRERVEYFCYSVLWPWLGRYFLPVHIQKGERNSTQSMLRHLIRFFSFFGNWFWKLGRKIWKYFWYSSIDGVCNWVLKGNERGGVNISVSIKRVVFSPD